MKCPKCDYLGFETGDRCKNCGYDFSLLASPEPEPADLSLTSPTRDDVPVGELWLAHSNATPQSTESQDALSSLESFPLFSPAGAGDEPLIRTPSEPRAPLAVRRSSDLSRSRGGSRAPRAIETGLTLEFAAEETLAAPVPSFRPEVATSIRPEVVSEQPQRAAATTGLAVLAARPTAHPAQRPASRPSAVLAAPSRCFSTALVSSTPVVIGAPSQNMRKVMDVGTSS